MVIVVGDILFEIVFVCKWWSFVYLWYVGIGML